MSTISFTRINGALLIAGTLLCVGTLQADEVRVMTSGGFAAPHLQLISPFERATKHKVVTDATSTGIGEDSISSRLRRGELVDVVILADAAIDELIKEGRVVAGSRVALLQAKSVAYSAQVSGVYLSTELFPRLGIAAQMRAKSQRIERERVGAVVARGEAEIGFQQISELLPIGGIDYVGPLPAEVQRVTVFSAGVAVGAKSPEAARALIRFFMSPEGAQAMTNSGLEPMTQR